MRFTLALSNSTFKTNLNMILDYIVCLTVALTSFQWLQSIDTNINIAMKMTLADHRECHKRKYCLKSSTITIAWHTYCHIRPRRIDKRAFLFTFLWRTSTLSFLVFLDSWSEAAFWVIKAPTSVLFCVCCLWSNCRALFHHHRSHCRAIVVITAIFDSISTWIELLH